MTSCTIDGCDKPHYGRGWCSAHYQRWRRHGDPVGGRTPQGALTEFIEQAVAYQGDGCLPWPYGRDGYGYGMIRVDGGKTHAHRRVLQLSTGQSGDEMEAAHAPDVCHNPSCVNPRHLRWVTRAENEADKLIDGTSNRGARNGRAKLTESDVLEIRDDPRPQRVIAVDYGVTRQTVIGIKRRKRWAWLDDLRAA